jgi:hypothetical protein
MQNPYAIALGQTQAQCSRTRNLEPLASANQS